MFCLTSCQTLNNKTGSIFFYISFPAPLRSLSSRLQLDVAAGRERVYGESSSTVIFVFFHWCFAEISHFIHTVCICVELAGVEVNAGNEEKPFDTRSFIMNRPQLEESQTRAQQQLQVKGEVHSAVPRTVQARYTHTHLLKSAV